MSISETPEGYLFTLFMSTCEGNLIYEGTETYTGTGEVEGTLEIERCEAMQALHEIYGN